MRELLPVSLSENDAGGGPGRLHDAAGRGRSLTIPNRRSSPCVYVLSHLTRPVVRTLRLLFVLLINVVLLWAVTKLYSNPWREGFPPADMFPLARGNASDDIRAEVTAQLAEFQTGYSRREGAQLGSFMERLFTADNVILLGTMPREVYAGFDRASKLIESDWASWGDCRFLIDRAHVSARGNVAWVATVGYVKFDLSRFLVLPLRLSGVLVKQDATWKFQFLQFQFDLDLGWVLLVEIVLVAWLAVNVGLLLWQALRSLRGRPAGH